MKLKKNFQKFWIQNVATTNLQNSWFLFLTMFETILILIFEIEKIWFKSNFSDNFFWWKNERKFIVFRWTRDEIFCTDIETCFAPIKMSIWNLNFINVKYIICRIVFIESQKILFLSLICMTSRFVNAKNTLNVNKYIVEKQLNISKKNAKIFEFIKWTNKKKIIDNNCAEYEQISKKQKSKSFSSNRNQRKKTLLKTEWKKRRNEIKNCESINDIFLISRDQVTQQIH